MFIVTLTYTAPLEEVDRHLDAHRAWLRGGLEAGWLLLAGRKEPRDGGVLILRGARAEVERHVAEDPFLIGGVATATILQVAPTMVAPGLEALQT